ncbi:MAG: N-acetylmuramoyl-L-alanine amidase [Kiritimatiellaeota bacterium]|nr:N-acetylmuramoyl-L-alanine amidase [Kiritimatiellota bacterium]
MAVACLFATLTVAQPPEALRTLGQVQGALGFADYDWDGDSVCLSNAAHVVRFYQGRRRAEVDGTVVLLNAAPDGSVKAGEWRMAAVDLDFLALSILPTDCNAIKPLRVVLDAGHGGPDSGARSRAPDTLEKDLTLALARRVGQRLAEMGMTVIHTRTNDVEVSLEGRAQVAREAKGDVFVSVHVNFADNKGASGVETYVLPPPGFAGTPEGSKPRGFQIGNTNDFHNTLLGYAMHKHLALADTDAPDRGLKRQSFFVLREACCPAVLVEVGFLSNAAEARKMLTPQWQEACVTAILRGVVEYARKADTLTLAVEAKRQVEREAKARAAALAAVRKAEAEAVALAAKKKAEADAAAALAAKKKADADAAEALAVKRRAEAEEAEVQAGQRRKEAEEAAALAEERKAEAAAEAAKQAPPVPEPPPQGGAAEDAPKGDAPKEDAPKTIFDFYQL